MTVFNSGSAGIKFQTSGNATASPPAQFKQYREADGRFHFKFAASDGRLLLQGDGFDAARDCGQLVARLKSADGLSPLRLDGDAVLAGDERIGTLAAGASLAELERVFNALRAA